MQGGSKHAGGLGGTAFVMTSGPNLAVEQAPKARLFAWAITNTSMLAQPVRSHPLPATASMQDTCLHVLYEAFHPNQVEEYFAERPGNARHQVVFNEPSRYQLPI